MDQQVEKQQKGEDNCPDGEETGPRAQKLRCAQSHLLPCLEGLTASCAGHLLVSLESGDEFPCSTLDVHH